MITDNEFRRINTFVKSKYGIDLTNKKEIVDGRLSNMLRREGWDNYSSYMNAVETDITGRLEKELVNLITTNHTYFMREFEHFDFMRSEILPFLKEKEASTHDLRIWCGAASSGEEPYMIAMLLIEYFGLEHGMWDTKVLATDISTNVLQTAINGIYTKEQISSIPDNWKRRFFRKIDDGERFEVTPELKNEVIFRQFNLMDPFPFRKKMHVIFLRNVMIYFDKETKMQLVKKLYDLLEYGGYLMIGRTETIDKDDVPFKMIQPSIFRKI